VIVLDASIVVDLLLDRPPYGGIAGDLVAEHGGDLHAPHLIDAEVTQILRRYVMRRAMRRDRASEAVDTLNDLPITRYPHGRFLQRSMEMSSNLTIYDALYVALAEALAIPLATRDGGIARSARRWIRVVHIR
jgi:predicted nucleic acid-binding protein